MARYKAQVATFRATVPLGLKIPAYAFEPKTLVDRYTQKKWQELGIVPSELCTVTVGAAPGAEPTAVNGPVAGVGVPEIHGGKDEESKSGSHGRRIVPHRAWWGNLIGVTEHDCGGRSARTRALGTLGGMALWVHSNRAAVDLQDWCDCAGRTMTIRVIESHRPAGPTDPPVPEWAEHQYEVAGR